MEAQDLRIGNWVIGSHSETPFKTEHHQVTGFDLYGNRNDYFQPIELTPELLKKCGFELDDDGTFWNDMGIKQSDDGFHFWVHIDDDPHYSFEWTKLEYLHQLQNLFHSLTGKEIEVNL